VQKRLCCVADHGVRPQHRRCTVEAGSLGYSSTNDVGIAYGPQGQRVLLAMTTRSQADDPKVENLRPLIGEPTTLVLPTLLA
jgi:beta-lactamase class A